MLDKIVHCHGPQFNQATLTQYNRFHDDKTQYTGVHAKGLYPPRGDGLHETRAD